MSIDVTFQPKGPTVLLGTTPAQVVPPGTGPGIVSFRIANNVLASPAATRLGWGDTSAKTSSAAPTGATQATSANSINIAAGAVVTLEFPSTIWFVASAAISLEITPGQGSTGT
jgi:hypothetical protein